MKILKKMLSLFLSAAIMVSVMYTGTVSANAAESDLPYVEMYESSYYKTFGYTLWLRGNQKQIWNDESCYSAKKCSHNKYYGMRYDLILEDGTSKYEFSMIRYQHTYVWWFYENNKQVYNVATVYSAETGWQDGVRFEISTNSPYYKKLLKCTKASVLNCMALDNECCTAICADGTKSNGKVEYAEVELHNLNVKLEEIQNKTKNISTLSISEISNKAYTGKAIKPTVTVKDGSTKLKKGTDYTVTYKNNTKIGTASVTIKGKGDYTGSKTIQFKIVPSKTTLKANKKSDTKVTLTWDKVKNAEKYQIYYSTNGGKYKKLATVSGSKTSYTNSKLDFKKNDYKFKIRAYDKVDGKTYYGSYSKAVTVK